MKTRFIFALSVLVASFMGHSLFAQSGEDTIVTTAYDTVVVFHHPEFSDCDTILIDYLGTLPQFSTWRPEEYYCNMVRHTQSTYEVYDSIYVLYRIPVLDGRKIFRKKQLLGRSHSSTFPFRLYDNHCRRCRTCKRAYLLSE